MTRKQSLSIALATASVFCMLAVTPLLAQTGEPSLGEVARKNRADKAKRPVSKERKEEISSRPMSTATVTNYGSSASLGSSSPDATSSATQPSADAASEKTAADSQNTSETAGQEPAKSGQEAKPDRVTELKESVESLTRVIEKLRAKADAASDDNRRQTMNEVIRNAEQELEKRQKELSEAERAAPKK